MILKSWGAKMEADEIMYGRCKGCGRIISDEELKVIVESRGEGLGSEEIVTGYTCYDCGHEEDY